MSGYTGIRKSKGSYELDLKNNKLYLANLTQALKGVPKKVLEVYAAEALLTAVDIGTKHDSSRAAANWELSFSGKGMRTELLPKYYNTYAIGSKGDGGINKSAVIDYKKMVYGIGEIGPSGFHTVLPDGLIHHFVQAGKPGTAPRVELVNPIAGDENPRREGADHTGNTYAYNAFFGNGSPLEAETASLSQKIGDGFIPWMVKQLNLAVRTATAEGRFLT